MLHRLTLLAIFATILSPSIAASREATFTVTLQTLWNATDHPNNYPASAHFSPLAGATHSDSVSFWAPGALASVGIERVAEIGVATQLLGEVDEAIAAGTALERVEINRNVFSGQSAVSDEFVVTDDFPLLSLASMVAPSSDWFIGVHDLDLRDGAGGFLEELVIDFNRFYDAGTEEGSAFSLSNPATVPQELITIVTGAAAAAPFLGAGANDLPPVVRLTITRVSVVPEPSAVTLLAFALCLQPAATVRERPNVPRRS